MTTATIGRPTDQSVDRSIDCISNAIAEQSSAAHGWTRSCLLNCHTREIGLAHMASRDIIRLCVCVCQDAGRRTAIGGRGGGGGGGGGGSAERDERQSKAAVVAIVRHHAHRHVVAVVVVLVATGREGDSDRTIYPTIHLSIPRSIHPSTMAVFFHFFYDSTSVLTVGLLLPLAMLLMTGKAVSYEMNRLKGLIAVLLAFIILLTSGTSATFFSFSKIFTFNLKMERMRIKEAETVLQCPEDSPRLGSFLTRGGGGEEAGGLSQGPPPTRWIALMAGPGLANEKMVHNAVTQYAEQVGWGGG